MTRPRLALLLALASALAAAPPAAAFDLQQVAGAFAQPVHVSGPPGDGSRVLVVEKAGRIQLVKDGVKAATPYLDLSAIVDIRRGALVRAALTLRAVGADGATARRTFRVTVRR